MPVMTPARIVQRSTLPSELAGAIPRDVQLSPAGRAVAAVAGGLAMAALVAAIAMSIAIASASGSHRRERVSVDAQILTVERTRDEQRRRTVTYQFVIDERSYQGRTRLHQGDHRDAFPGMFVPVEYVVSDPRVSWIKGYEPRGIPPWIIPIVSGLLLAGAFGIVHGLRRAWMLLSEGRPARARVVTQKKVHRSEHTAYHITCEFEDLSGATHTMGYDVMKAPPAVGSELTVVYHRDDPRWHAVYPLRLVRPVRAPERSRRTRHRQDSFLAGRV